MFLGISDDIVKKDGDFMMRIGGINSPLEATRFGETPKIQKKAVEASKNAMTDDFVEKLKELARRGCSKRGVGGMRQRGDRLLSCTDEASMFLLTVLLGLHR